MKHSERVAQVVVEAVIQGSRMVYRRDQRLSVHDFDLHYADGRVAAMEVTASVNKDDEGTHAAILNARKGGPKVKAELCKKAWRIWPGSGATINRIRASIDRYLAPIESAGIERFFSASDRHKHVSVDNIYKDLQVSGGYVMKHETPGYIHIAFPLGGGPVGAGLVHEAVRLEAFKEDNRRKLAAAGTAERHLFVFVDVLNRRVWTALVDLSPPMDVLELPEEITDVWVVGPAQSNHQYVVWQGTRDSAWRRLEPVTTQVPKSHG